MTLLLAVVIVSAASTLLRAVPLLGAGRLPDAVAEAAGWAGLGVIAAMAVRATLAQGSAAGHLAGVLAVGVAVAMAARGTSTLTAVAAGLATYLLLTPLTSLG